MPFGDDDRREKSDRHREAAFARWENRGERARRRTREGTVDTFDVLLGIVISILRVPVVLLRYLYRGAAGIDPPSISGLSWGRDS